jgi:hypothetical protein
MSSSVSASRTIEAAAAVPTADVNAIEAAVTAAASRKTRRGMRRRQSWASQPAGRLLGKKNGCIGSPKAFQGNSIFNLSVK